MKSMFTIVLALLLGILPTIFADSIILQPLASTSKLPQACLTFIQGAGIKPENYKSIAIAFQNALASKFQLWVGIPEFLGDVAEPLVLDGGIEKILKQMQSEGMQSDAPLIMAGHSLGGAMVQMWTDQNADRVRAQVLMGSFLTRTYKDKYVFSYKVPTLTIGAELDGLARVTRMAEAFYTQILDPNQDEKSASQNFPVTIIKGANHLAFAEGEPPLLVKKRDLKAEISFDQAHQLIAADAAAFIRAQLIDSDTSARNTLASRLQESKEFVAPIIEAFKREGYHNFRPPCMCKEDVCEPAETCTAGCPWTNEISQKMMGAGLDGMSINNRDSFHDVWETQPHVHLPKINNSCQNPKGCTLQTQTITQGVYHTGEDLEIWKIHFDVKELDTGFLPISAAELRTKMSSRQNLYQHAGLENQSFDELDGTHTICKDINQVAWDYALQHGGKRTTDRFSKVGQPYKMVSDKDVCAAGPCWIWSELSFKETSSGDAVEVAAPQFSTSTEYIIPAAAGYHYCKVLSPARAMEWIYVDGLRENFALSSEKKNLRKA